MSRPEGEFSMDDLFGEIRRDGGFDSALVGSGLQEIYRSGKFASFPIPEGSALGPRTVNAVHMAAKIGETVDLLEFIPDASIEYQETLQRLLRQQLLAFDPGTEVDEEALARAISLAQEDGVRVFGAFQLGTLGDGRRSTEIFFPKAFARATNSIIHAVTLSAAILRYAQ